MLVRVRRTTKDTQGLTTGVEYLVVQISDLSYRLVNDDGDPVLYRKDRFVVVDDRIPNDWVRDEYPDGEYFAGPPETETRGFWERWHDRDPEAQRIATDSWNKLAIWHLARNATSATLPGRLGKTE